MFSNTLSILFTSNELTILSLVSSMFFSMVFGYSISKKVEKVEKVEVEKKVETVATEILIERAEIRVREANKLLIETNKKEQDLIERENKLLIETDKKEQDLVERMENLNEREINLNEYQKDLVERENYVEIKEQFLQNFEKTLNDRREFMLEEELQKHQKQQKVEPTIYKKIYKDIIYIDYKDFFILSGFGTKRNREEIKKLGGNWVPSQSFWLFQNSEKDKVQFFLNSL